MKQIVLHLVLLGLLGLTLTGCTEQPPQPTAGWHTINGQQCWLDETGQPLTGWQTLEGNVYCLREDGSPMTGWVPGEDGSRYFNEAGIMLTGVQDVDGERCYFTPDGIRVYLVNAENPLPPDYTVELRSIGGNHQIAATAYEDFTNMMADCKAAGCQPAVCSSYRSQEKQESLFRRKVRYFQKQGYSDPDAVEMAGTVVAAPGTSEHQLGLALDIVDAGNWNLDETQENTPTQKWLMAHSWEYGFILRYPNNKSEITGVIYEPWHYRYVGHNIAASLYESGQCLEEFLGADALASTETVANYAE